MPRRRIVKRPSAIQDVIEAADYIAQNSSLAMADRFVAAVEATIDQIARVPGIGTRYERENPAFGELRVSSIRRFRKHLVFYRPMDGGVEIVRVLHGARDIAGVLAEEFDAEDEEPDAEANA